MTIRSFTALDAIAAGAVTVSCVFTGRTEEIEADAVVLVTSRAPEDRLARELAARAGDWADAGIESVAAIGDALAPATIAHAVYAGRRYAEELDGSPDDRRRGAFPARARRASPPRLICAPPPRAAIARENHRFSSRGRQDAVVAGRTD